MTFDIDIQIRDLQAFAKNLPDPNNGIKEGMWLFLPQVNNPISNPKSYAGFRNPIPSHFACIRWNPDDFHAEPSLPQDNVITINDRNKKKRIWIINRNTDLNNLGTSDYGHDIEFEPSITPHPNPDPNVFTISQDFENFVTKMADVQHDQINERKSINPILFKNNYNERALGARIKFKHGLLDRLDITSLKWIHKELGENSYPQSGPTLNPGEHFVMENGQARSTVLKLKADTLKMKFRPFHSPNSDTAIFVPKNNTNIEIINSPIHDLVGFIQPKFDLSEELDKSKHFIAFYETLSQEKPNAYRIPQDKDNTGLHVIHCPPVVYNPVSHPDF